MSPELTAAIKDEQTFLALQRLYNYKKLRELKAPPVIIEHASQLLDKSRVSLGKRYDAVLSSLFDQFKEYEDARVEAEQAWETKCRSCVHWIHGYDGPGEEQWCGRHSYETKMCPDPCPDFQANDGEE